MNNSARNTCFTECDFQRSTGVLVVKLTVLFINSLLAVAGNTLLVVSVYKRPLLHRVTYYLVSVLAVEDLLASLTYAAFQPQAFILGDWIIGDAACAACIYLTLMFSLLELYLMAAISADRYVACCKPLRYSNIVTLLRCKFVVGVLFLISFTLTNVAIFECDTYGYDSYTNLCHPEFFQTHKASVCMTILFFLTILPCSLTMGICQYKILKQVRKVTHNAPPNMASTRGGSTSGSSGFNKATIMVSLLTGTYIVCWFPLLLARSSGVVVDWNASPSRQHAFVILEDTTFHIYMVFANPVIYGIYNREFRRECKKVVRKSDR